MAVPCREPTAPNGFQLAQRDITDSGWAGCSWNRWFGHACGSSDDETGTFIFTGRSVSAFAAVGAIFAGVTTLALLRGGRRASWRFALLLVAASSSSGAAAILTALGSNGDLKADVGPFVWVGLAGVATCAAALAAGAQRDRMPKVLTITLACAGVAIVLTVFAVRLTISAIPWWR